MITKCTRLYQTYTRMIEMEIKHVAYNTINVYIVSYNDEYVWPKLTCIWKYYKVHHFGKNETDIKCMISHYGVSISQYVWASATIIAHFYPHLKELRLKLMMIDRATLKVKWFKRGTYSNSCKLWALCRCPKLPNANLNVKWFPQNVIGQTRPTTPKWCTKSFAISYFVKQK